MNKLILGDNLAILRKLESESVDLIYLDPPFFSNRNYEVIWGDEGEIRSFQDRWSGGIDHYIAWLKERVIEMHRILKPTGSIFLHCDWHADAYIRVFILDKIFEQNFQSHIVWRRTTAHGNAKQGSKRFETNFDSIYHYSKTKKFLFKSIYTEFKEEQIQKQYNKIDEKGKRYRLVTPTAAKGGGDTSYEFHGVKPPKGRFWAYSKTNMEKFHEEGKLYFSKTGQPYIKYYLDERPGVAVMSFWDDIKPMSPTSKERIGYPTQKPEKLLERIISCASNEGDIILDPFVGGGTTCAVADRLKRQWIGIDQSVQAVKVTELRLQKQRDLFSAPFVTELHKYDYDTLRYGDAFEFESFIIQQYGATPNAKQRSDKGIDGKTQDNTPIQVKRSDNIGRNVIDNFKAACERFDKNLFETHKNNKQPIGYIIAFSFGKGAIQEVARLKNQENLIIELLKVEDIVPIAKKPVVTLNYQDLGIDNKNRRKIEFIATAESDIEFFAWNWHYQSEQGFKADIMLDKTGKQTHLFKNGQYNIAVMVVDNEGLESLEIISLKINGGISKNN